MCGLRVCISHSNSCVAVKCFIFPVFSLQTGSIKIPTFNFYVKITTTCTNREISQIRHIHAFCVLNITHLMRVDGQQGRKNVAFVDGTNKICCGWRDCVCLRFLWPCIVISVWRERKKPTRCVGSCDRASWSKCEEREKNNKMRRFLWPCIVIKVWRERKIQQDA